jgi:hypothetical protein
MVCIASPDGFEVASNIIANSLREERCKYPPAEPGALRCEPLKAAWAGSLTRPRRYCGRLMGGYFHIRNWSSRLSSTSWLRMYSRIAFSSRPTVDTK